MLFRSRTLTPILAVFAFIMLTTEPARASEPLVVDKTAGHSRDLSYEALTDEGLSWETRTRLFGGETVHYGELTDGQAPSLRRSSPLLSLNASHLPVEVFTLAGRNRRLLRYVGHIDRRCETARTTRVRKR